MGLNRLFQRWLREARGRVFLDAAAGLPETPASRRARRRAERATGGWANPSSPHAEGREAKRVLEGSRLLVARTFGVREGEVIFCSGGTEAANLGLLGAARAAAKPVTVAVAASSHPSVARAAEAAAREGATAVVLAVDADGRIDPRAAAAAVSPSGTTIVAVPRVAGETGAVSDTRAIRAAIDAAAPGRAIVFVDAAQAALVEDVSPSRLQADIVALDGSKVGGPRGSGCLLARVDLAPVIVGGRQEGGRRAGTENVPAVAGLAVALAEAKRRASMFAAASARTVAALWDAISAAVPAARRNVPAKISAPHFLSVCFPNVDGAYLAAVLDELGVSASPSAACRAAAGEAAAGYPDQACARSSVRLTVPPGTSPRAARRVARALARSAALASRPTGAA